MPFGKYRNVSLSLIPSGYFEWILKQDWFIMKYDELAYEIEQEMKERTKWGTHFWDDKVDV